MEIISRADARKAKLTRYFTGNPCLRGHIAPRAVKNGTCCRCSVDVTIAWQKKNAEKVEATKRRWFERNPGGAAKQSKIWYETNLERAKSRRKEYKKKHPEMVSFCVARQYATRKLRIPKWLDDADWRMIRHAYKVAVEKTKETGVDWEVDHVLPLCGKTVSGFHTWQNLRVIPAVDNNKKNNQFEPYSVVHVQ